MSIANRQINTITANLYNVSKGKPKLRTIIHKANAQAIRVTKKL